MPAYVRNQQANPLFAALGGITRNIQEGKRQGMADQQQKLINDSTLAKNTASTNKINAETEGVNFTNESRRGLGDVLQGLEAAGLDGNQIAGLANASGGKVNLPDFLKGLNEIQYKNKASEGFAADPNQARFNANLGGAKVDDNFSQNGSGQALNLLTGSTDSSGGLAQSIIGKNNASAGLDRRKTDEVGVEKPVSALTQAKLDKTNLEIGNLKTKNSQADRLRDNAIDTALYTAKNRVAAVADAEGQVDGLSSGFLGGLTSKIPGFPSFSLAQKLETINSGLGLDELLRVKREGGTLGALSNRELSVLQTSIANLNQYQDPEQLKSQLGVVQEHYERFISVLEQENGTDEQPEQAPSVAPMMAKNPSTGETIQSSDGGQTWQPVGGS